MMTFEQRMLHAAQHSSGQATDVLRYVNDLYELWRDALQLPEMDRETFTGHALINAPRYAIKGSAGLALEPIWLAAIVSAAARMELDHAQLLSLRADIESVNRKIIEIVTVQLIAGTT